MSLNKMFGLLIASVVLGGLAPGSGKACSCLGPRTVCEAYAGATAVFVGVVSSISDTSIKLEGGGQTVAYMGKLVRFSVERVYKGLDSAEISVETGSGGGDCGYYFELGTRYLVYAFVGSQGQLSTGICSRTNSIAEASEDLDYLEGLPESATKSRLSGVVVEYTNERDKNGYQLERPMAGTRVAITGKGGHYDAVTDQHGLYQVVGLAPGKYRVKVQLPENLALIDETGKDYIEATLPSGGCGIANLLAQIDGRIVGTVFDSQGHPIKGISVDLAPADSKDASGKEIHLDSRSEESGKDGRYEFRRISPGRYYLGLNLEKEPSGDSPFSRTYYPGSPDRDRATVIELRNGEKLAGYNIFLPGPMPTRVIEGTFVWSSGKPVKPGHVFLTDSPEIHKGRWYSSAEVDENGHFTMKAFDGLECWVHASTYYSFGTRMQFVDIQPTKIVVNTSTQPLRLVAPVPSEAVDK